MRLALSILLLCVLAGCNSARVDDRDGDGLGTPSFRDYAAERRAAEPEITMTDLIAEFNAGWQAELDARDAAHKAELARRDAEHEAKLEQGAREATANAISSQTRTYAWAARIATIAGLVGIGVTIALPWVPNRLALACGAVAIVAGVGQIAMASLTAFERWIPLVTVVGVGITLITVVIPWITAAIGKRNEAKGKALAMKGHGEHAADGVALIAEARNLSPEDRKAELDKYQSIHERRDARARAA